MNDNGFIVKAAVVPLVTSSFVLGACAQEGTLDGWNGFLVGLNVMVFLMASVLVWFVLSED